MKIRIKQIKSGIKIPANQKKTLKALGFRKMNQTIEHEDTPQILGMVNQLKHLLTVEKI